MRYIALMKYFILSGPVYMAGTLGFLFVIITGGTWLEMALYLLAPFFIAFVIFTPFYILSWIVEGIRELLF
ncbi:hypothetical protein [Psychromonas aquatilis]|uniref:Uncharacterized protein n=1 Tax=Psychromonas aquatilis TaxID=2005072 RepID=A0ABU9GLB8_9GAMM